jgi:hypothetical protein
MKPETILLMAFGKCFCQTANIQQAVGLSLADMKPETSLRWHLPPYKNVETH